MEDNTQVSSGQPQTDDSVINAGETQTPASSGDTVKHETYLKVLGEAKAAKKRAEEAQNTVQALELEKLNAEGKKDEIITLLNTQLSETRSKLENSELSSSRAILGNQVSNHLASMGCIDTDRAMRLIDIDGIPVDPVTRKADTDSIRVILEEKKKQMPYFFGKPAPNVQDVIKQDVVLSTSDKAVKDLSREELQALISRMGKEKMSF